MAHVSLRHLTEYCDRLLHTSKINDYDGAYNGLQVANRGKVTRVCAAVDASLATVRSAADEGADLLIVHHGLFWSARHPWTGRNYELIGLLLNNNLAVYSAHLPLDVHPTLGNNAQLSAALGLKNLKPFFLERDQFLGLRTTMSIARVELMDRLRLATGANPALLPGGPKTCRRIGIVTGGAGSHLKTAADEGVDTFISGEGPHWTYALAEELGINVLYGGHYATETFGVKALAEHLSRHFKVPWSFVDHPTGL
jgi:dinuclear metal center YbgI/SA1388 family protein